MNTETFLAAYREGRNGCNNFYRHPLARNFAYSDGVGECADAGCHWLIDIFATELPAVFRANAHISDRAILHAVVRNNKARLRAEFEDDLVAWSRDVDYTDMPDGEYLFMMAFEPGSDAPYRLILVSEY